MKRMIAWLLGMSFLATAFAAMATLPTASVETIGLDNVAAPGMPQSFKVTIYRTTGVSQKQPLVIFVPRFDAEITDTWYRQQAAYFTGAGYVVAIPQLTGLYRLYERRPVFDFRWALDLAGSAAPSAFEVLATVAALSGPNGPATPVHFVLGVEFGAIIAARYAAVNPRGLRGLIMVSAGFGYGSSDVMNASEDAFKMLGTKVKVPSLWLYAQGNWRISDATVKELFAAFHSGSPAATLDILPAFGGNGDALFSSDWAPPVWQPEVARFLAPLAHD